MNFIAYIEDHYRMMWEERNPSPKWYPCRAYSIMDSIFVSLSLCYAEFYWTLVLKEEDGKDNINNVALEVRTPLTWNMYST